MKFKNSAQDKEGAKLSGKEDQETAGRVQPAALGRGLQAYSGENERTQPTIPTVVRLVEASQTKEPREHSRSWKHRQIWQSRGNDGKDTFSEV